MTKEEFSKKLAEVLWWTGQWDGPQNEIEQEILHFLDREVNISLTIFDPWTDYDK